MVTMMLPAQTLEQPETITNPLEDTHRFVFWVESHTPQERLGRCDDAAYDPLSLYLREVWGAPAPYVGSDFWMADRFFPQQGFVCPTPQWASDLIYILGVYPAHSDVTAEDVMNALRCCRITR